MTDPNQKPALSFIVAMAQNRTIGKDGDMPWHIADDLKRFKKLTMGHPVVMGRRTWESLPKKPLAGRRNIVLSQSEGFAPQGAEVVRSVNELFKVLRGYTDEVFVIGGASVYNLLMPFARRLYVTQIYRDVEGDAFFPVVDMSEFNMVSLGEPQTDEESGLDYAYEEYERKFRL